MKLIPITKGLFVQVDDADFEWLSQWKWQASSGKTNIYAQRGICGENGKPKTITMHRLILGLTDKNVWCDHKDGDGLNNQRENLRQCTRSENNRNHRSRSGLSSRFTGVYFNLKSRKWRANIGFLGGQKYLGSFESEDCAAAAYNFAAKNIFGEFARLNDVKPMFLEVNIEKIILRSSNTSGFRGVSFCKDHCMWIAMFRGKKIGRFNLAYEAAVAYDLKAKEEIGDKAVLNF